ncbi:MAG: hypothetical protein HY047_18895 [Acidobacteria bacterium]|nr:hypothetical protein [Acidobacteriota bacterium]
MKTIGWMVGASVVSWLAAVGWVGTRTGLEVLLGMIAPLAVASGTWALIERTYRRDPERVTALMIAAFAGKMVFFGAYVAVMLKGLALHPVPFVASFASYFIALHLIEALALRRLFAGGSSAAPRRG